MANIEIEFCNPNNTSDTYKLRFEVFDTTIAKRWVDLVLISQRLYNIDDPKRFYGFDLPEKERELALKLINSCIATINSYQPIINRTLDSVEDQDTLNYLHHIFEKYHGLLDQQNTDFWINAPKEVQQALANLNIYVHRCESANNNVPRFVVTWYGLPKVCEFEISDYDLFTPYRTFGMLYINYVEIGKDLKDLWHDKDQYIDDDAFKPYKYFSSDFSVVFVDDDINQKNQIIEEIWNFYKENEQFFSSKSYTYRDKRLTAASVLPVAKLIYDDKQTVLDNIKTRQMIKNVKVFQ